MAWMVPQVQLLHSLWCLCIDKKGAGAQYVSACIVDRFGFLCCMVPPYVFSEQLPSLRAPGTVVHLAPIWLGTAISQHHGVCCTGDPVIRKGGLGY